MRKQLKFSLISEIIIFFNYFAEQINPKRCSHVWRRDFSLVCKQRLIYKLMYGMEPPLSEEVKGYVNFRNIIRAAVPLWGSKLDPPLTPTIRLGSGDHGRAVCLLIVGGLTLPPSSSIRHSHFYSPLISTAINNHTTDLPFSECHVHCTPHINHRHYA